MLAVLPFFAFAQKQDSIPFSGAVKVIVKNGQKAKDNYLTAGNKFADLEYKIGKKDSEFNQISTAPLTIEGTNYYRELTFEVSAKDGEIIITPKTKRLNNLMGALQSENVFEPTPFGKNKLSKDIYGRLEKLAKSIGGKIIYSE